MAIIVGKHTRAVIEPTFTPYEGLCRTHTVVINSNGSVNISTLDLGYMNENGVTVINIDTSNLIWNSLVDANAELFDVYQPILTFEHEDGSRLSLDCLIEDDEENGNVFIVSNEITAKPGQYKINFVLRERTTEEEDYPGNVGKEDDVNYSEVFASATFFGVVNILPYSTIESSFQEEDVTNLIYQDPVALQKPTIVLEWKGNNWAASATQIGYVGDNLMTPIQFRGLPKNGLNDCTVTVLMYNDNFAYKFVFEHSESIPVSMPLTIWTPQAITDPNHNTLETNTWNCAIKVEKDDQIAYTSTIALQVLNTMVPSTELNTDATEMLLASNESGEGTPVHAEFTTTRPYVLGYTGDTINELLDLVYNNSEAFSSLDTYVDDKINAKLEENITQALDDEY